MVHFRSLEIFSFLHGCTSDFSFLTGCTWDAEWRIFFFWIEAARAVARCPWCLAIQHDVTRVFVRRVDGPLTLAQIPSPLWLPSPCPFDLCYSVNGKLPSTNWSINGAAPFGRRRQGRDEGYPDSPRETRGGRPCSPLRWVRHCKLSTSLPAQ
jgi:hypothetical protein